MFDLTKYASTRFAGTNHPFEEVEWTTIECKDLAGQEIEVESPVHWSDTAVAIAFTRYMRRDGVPSWKGTEYVPPVVGGRETSIKQLIHRVAHFISTSCYVLAPENRENLYKDLCWLLLHQWIGFNTPAWMNAGLYSVYGIKGSKRTRYWYDPDKQRVKTLNYDQIRPGVAACFLTTVKDCLHGTSSMYEYINVESLIFSMGAGNGANISAIRGRGEPISGGGIAEGIIPFLCIPDVSAAYIKSGGVSRRAARMLVCDVDHPDIVEFIQWKGKEEQKVLAMAQGFLDMYEKELIDAKTSDTEMPHLLRKKWYDLIDYRGELYRTVSGQQANNSVRLFETFMKAVQNNGDWELSWRTDSSVKKTMKARDIWNMICEQAWKSGDPGLFYDGTIQKWNTVPHYSEIKTSNPCLSANSHILTESGFKRIGNMINDSQYDGTPFNVIGGDGKVVSTDKYGLFLTKHDAGVVRVTFSNGLSEEFTPDHQLQLLDGTFKAVSDISVGKDKLKSLWNTNFNHNRSQRFEALRYWSADLQQDYSKGQLAGWWFGDGCWIKDNNRQDRLEFAVGINDTPCIKHLQSLIKTLLLANDDDVELKPHCQKPDTCQLLTLHKQKYLDNAIRCGIIPNKNDFQLLNKTLPYQLGFIEGLIMSDGTVRNPDKCRELEIYNTNKSVLEDVLRVMIHLGIHATMCVHGKEKCYIASDGRARNNQTCYKIRTADPVILQWIRLVGFGITTKSLRLSKWNKSIDEYTYRYRDLTIEHVESCGVADVYDITVPEGNTFICGAGNIVHNCGEIMQPDYTSCNLCSVNLLKFNENTVADFVDTAKIVILSLETIAHNSSTPTPLHAETTHKLRPLGANLGNIGGYLMCQGIPYDSKHGREIIASWTGLFTAACWQASAQIAKRVGAYPEYNEDNHYAIIQQHYDAIRKLNHRVAAQVGAMIYESLIKDKVPFRNDAVTAFVPMGTIGIVMDCVTYGIEPEFALKKRKQLAEGGYIDMVNKGVSEALKRLGYEDTDRLADEIIENNTVVGIVKPEHEAIFDCANECSAGRFISPEGHVDMMAAVQPHISLSISKTVNMPNKATVEDISNVFMRGWKKGLKNITIYRYDSKMSQPLNKLNGNGHTTKKEITDEDVDAALEHITGAMNNG